jgi:hypothetical protein
LRRRRSTAARSNPGAGVNGILSKAVDRTLDLIDALDDLIAQAAQGFAAATPMIIDLKGDVPSESNRAGT